MAKGSNHLNVLALDDLELSDAIDEFVSPDKSKAEIEAWEVKRFVEAHLHQEPDHFLIQTEIIQVEEILQQLLSITSGKQSKFKTDLIITTFQNIEPSLSLAEKIINRAKLELNMGDI